MIPYWNCVPALGLVVLAATQASAGTVSPSFDCSRAKSPDEQQICKDDRLAELDQATAIAFEQALKAGPKRYAAELKKQIQRDVRAETKIKLDERRACGAESICILDAQIATISYLGEVGSTVPVPPWVGEYRLNYSNLHPDVIEATLPTGLGHCTRTRIASITGRFGETLSWPRRKDEEVSGTAVEYANGAAQVSYNYEDDVARSQIGDEVLLCLSKIPRKCPPGDDRGRGYSATNVKSATSWIMPDSQHACGGL
jgi:uncharacterized protein